MSRSRNDLRIRLARLDDAAAIVDIHRSHVPRWHRRIGDEEHDVSYSDLTLDERCGFGGPWMSVETCAVHLNNLLARRALPFVAEQDGRVVAEMELFVGREGPRYGKNCHIGLLFVDRDCLGHGTGNQLVEHAAAVAKEQGCDTLTVASDENHEGFYRHCGFSFGDVLLSVEVYPEKRPVELVRLPPQASAQSFTWGMEMPIGRLQSSAAHLADLAEDFAIPTYGEICKRASFLKIGGQDALIAHVRHGSGHTHVAAWTRDVKIGDLVDASLALMSDAGISTAYMFLYKDDYESLGSRLASRQLGQRRTLVYRL